MAFRAFWNSPMGPKTTHFWGPVANWGFVISGMVDTQKPPEVISGNMTGVMCVFSALCMRFAWMVRPRNYLLLVCHASNESVQLFQLSRLAQAQGFWITSICMVIMSWDFLGFLFLSNLGLKQFASYLSHKYWSNNIVPAEERA